MSRDGWLEIATSLRTDQAGMLQGLLRSAGIDVLTENVASAGLNLDVLGGAKVLVRAADAERATQIYEASGLFSASPNGGEEIPEEEWSRPAPEQVEPPAPAADHAKTSSSWALSPDDRFLMGVVRDVIRFLTRLLT